MTETPAPVRERPGGYRRSSSGLIGALLATVVAVLVFVGVRALFRADPATPVQAVDWTISFQAGRADGRLQVLAPARLPSGWKATSVSYTPGTDPVWHLGMLTSSTKYLGIDESRDDLGTLVHRSFDEDATQGRDVTVGGRTWHVFTDRRGDYALGRTVKLGRGATEAQVVGGSAPDATVRDFVAQLRGGRVKSAG